MFPKIILLYFFLIITRQFAKAATVVEVLAGHLAELPCLSIDDQHRFMFWQLIDDKDIVGPGNDIDQEKYDYEVLSGKLYIKGVSTAEGGFYRCVSRGIEDNSAIKIHMIELIVIKDFAFAGDSYELKLLTGMAATAIVVVGIALTLFILIFKRRQTQGFFDLEDSRGNSPVRYVRPVQSAIPAPKTVESEGIDNFGMEVDFPKVFQQLQKGETMPM